MGTAQWTGAYCPDSTFLVNAIPRAHMLALTTPGTAPHHLVDMGIGISGSAPVIVGSPKGPNVAAIATGTSASMAIGNGTIEECCFDVYLVAFQVQVVDE
jgi:hypothetical protein